MDKFKMFCANAKDVIGINIVALLVGVIPAEVAGYYFDKHWSDIGNSLVYNLNIWSAIVSALLVIFNVVMFAGSQKKWWIKILFFIAWLAYLLLIWFALTFTIAIGG
ncbi:MAG: hypothetical protein WC457_04020 [Patescibacteria group bacterium]